MFYRLASNVIFFILLSFGVCHAADVIPNYSNETLASLNEELRKLDQWNDRGEETKLNTPKPLDMQNEGFTNTGEAKGLIIENRTSDPASPVIGQIWYRSDL